MSKITSSLPPHKKTRKQKILANQKKIDQKNSKAKIAAKMQAEDERIALRKSKAADKIEAAKEREAALEIEGGLAEFDFASDEAGEFAMSLCAKGTISPEEISAIKGSGKDKAITVGDIKKAAKIK